MSPARVQLENQILQLAEEAGRLARRRSQRIAELFTISSKHCRSGAGPGVFGGHTSAKSDLRNPHRV